MKRTEQLQSQWFAEKADVYDRGNLRDADEHYAALRHISAFVQMLRIESILDVGCGTGRGVKYFLEIHPDIRIRGLDPVQAMLGQAISAHGIAPELLCCGAGEEMPFPDGSFDAVCELGMLHHVAKPNVVVKEMIRVARRAIFLSDSNRFGQGSLLSRFIKLVLCKAGLWGAARFIRTGGKGYTVGDGLQFSYSVFDSLSLLAGWADRIILIPTRKRTGASWFQPLMTSPHILVCAFKEET